ncbi:hypothetical protein [Micromonospora globbae]|uniref:hypothetical protein n=1 Tax=Micromonospora globbae TaxID=1894969 RepID=UPI00342156EA
MLDLRHLGDLPLLVAPSRRRAHQDARAAGLRPRNAHQALTAAGAGWVVGDPAGEMVNEMVGDVQHWMLLADLETTIVVPAPATPVLDPAQPPLIGDDWRARHRACTLCDWHMGHAYRRLTAAAWRRRTAALLPWARAGDRHVPAVRDHLVTALRMHQTGRLHEAAYWLACAERAAQLSTSAWRHPPRRRSR